MILIRFDVCVGAIKGGLYARKKKTLRKKGRNPKGFSFRVL